MDAYDIFKKLTKGLKFKNRVLGSKPEVPTSKVPVTARINKLELTENVIKAENDGVQEDGILVEDVVSDQGSQSGSDKEEAEKDEHFPLMDGVKVGKRDKKKGNKLKTEDLQKKLELEEHNRYRNEHGIRVVGRAVPPALQDFISLMVRYQVPEVMVNTLRECGYTEPTPIQLQAIPCMLENRQILACAPTGSGKTAAFLLPIMHSLGAGQGGPRALILCPTRELAKQIYREALRLTAGTSLRCSVVSKICETKVKERESTIRKSDIVISTPNRLCYLMNQENVNISLERVKWLIVDEADKMFEGSAEQESDFRQQLEQVMTACSGRERRVAMFSATHTPAVAKWCRHNMKGLINITVGQRNAATTLVEQELLYCGNEAGKLIAFRQLVQQGLKPPVLVFVQSKDRAKQLFKELIYDGINVDAIHADRTQAQRDNVVRSFRVGKIWVLICTELMGRGIDFRGVNLVLNYDFPPSAISYIHRVGRAGRAGQKGRAITFFTQDDIGNLRSIAAVMKQSGCEVPEFMLKLKQNANKRKRLAKKAPRRDEISTVLHRKRKLDNDDKENSGTQEKRKKFNNSAAPKENQNKKKHKKVKPEALAQKNNKPKVPKKRLGKNKKTLLATKSKPKKKKSKT